MGIVLGFTFLGVLMRGYIQSESLYIYVRSSLKYLDLASTKYTLSTTHLGMRYLRYVL